jgi:hypothetical protein
MSQPVIATNYQSDSTALHPGTVVQFGGEAEVTLGSPQTTAIAGVVVTTAETILNSTLTGVGVVAVATQGRVTCGVLGTALQGDLLMAGPGGMVQSVNQVYFDPEITNGPSVGSIIGRAITNSDNGTVEVALNIS